MEEVGKPVFEAIVRFYKTRPRYLWMFTNYFVDQFLENSDYRNLSLARIEYRWKDSHGSKDAILKNEDDLHNFFSGNIWPGASPEFSRQFWQTCNCWQKDREGVSAKDFCEVWHLLQYAAHKDKQHDHIDGMHPTWHLHEVVHLHI